MRVIKREMLADERVRTANDTIDEYLPYSQASFNSDGCITIRNYDKSNKNKDEIILLSPAETDALFELFSRIEQKKKRFDLPF